MISNHIKSMTAFANIEKNQDELQLSWELRSVNHRYLDISLYLPEGFRLLENDLKDILRKELGRGKVDAKLVYNSLADVTQKKINIDQTELDNLLEAQKQLEKMTNKEMSLSANEILHWPGVLSTPKMDFSPYMGFVETLLKEALGELIKSREEEGKRLSLMIQSRASSISEIVNVVRTRRASVMQALREKVLKKITELELPLTVIA